MQMVNSAKWRERWGHLSMKGEADGGHIDDRRRARGTISAGDGIA
jgi:hypothetical protein